MSDPTPTTAEHGAEELRALLAKATPGPWRFDGDWHRLPSVIGGQKIIADIRKSPDAWARGDRSPEDEANAALIVAAVNALPGLLAALSSHAADKAALEARVQTVREQGQAEGIAAAVQWLRDRSAIKPPATLWHAALILADQLEASRTPGDASREPRHG